MAQRQNKSDRRSKDYIIRHSPSFHTGSINGEKVKRMNSIHGKPVSVHVFPFAYARARSRHNSDEPEHRHGHRLLVLCCVHFSGTLEKSITIDRRQTSSIQPSISRPWAWSRGLVRSARYHAALAFDEKCLQQQHQPRDCRQFAWISFCFRCDSPSFQHHFGG